MKYTKHFSVLTLFLLSALSIALITPAFAGHMSESSKSAPLAIGQIFPDEPIRGQVSPETKAYLGLDASGQGFVLSDLTAQVVIVEIFSMYCPYCQEEAPVTQELFSLIHTQGLDGKVKIIGIGAGNTQFEVDVFHDKYGIPFPLFPDEGYAVHKACGEVGTPFFYVLAKDPKSGAYVVRHVQEGQMEGAKSFLDTVLKKTGLN